MTHKARSLAKEYVMTAGVKKRLANNRGLVELLCGVCHKPIVVGDVVVPWKSWKRTISHKSCVSSDGH